MPHDIFTGWVAEGYDRDSSAVFSREVVEATVAFLAATANGGPALELGVGTGRIALPLQQRGVEVHGIDISSDMVAQLRAKPGGGTIGVTVGDFATTRVAGSFALVFVVYNTIGNLTTQDEQVACFANAAAHLAPGGRFVVELGVPDLRRFPPGAAAQPFAVGPEHIAFDTLDLASQQGVSHHYFVRGDRVAVFAAPFRWAWPAELDLMARLAGLSLQERWADWDRSPFTDDSRKHVSVWVKPA